MTSSLEREGVGGPKDDEWRHDDTGGGAFELKKIIIDPVYTVLPRKFFFSTITRLKEGGGAERWHDDTGGGGDWRQNTLFLLKLYKTMTLFMNSPLLAKGQ